MARGKRTKESKREYPDACTEYIYSPVHISIDKLSKKWKGVKGHSFSRLLQRSQFEYWVERRKKYQADINARMAEQIAKEKAKEQMSIVNRARKDHFIIGQMLMAKSASCLKNDRKITFTCKKCETENIVRLPIDDLMKPNDVARFAKDGVDIQRKGLGINEAITVQLEMKEMVSVVINIIRKHVIDVSMYTAIQRDLIDLQKQTDEQVDGLLKTRYQLEETTGG